MKILIFTALISSLSFATCTLVDQGPGRCNMGSGSGADVRTIQEGRDKCPGKNRFVMCKRKGDANLQIDFRGVEDRCVKTVCHAPGGGQGNNNSPTL